MENHNAKFKNIILSEAKDLKLGALLVRCGYSLAEILQSLHSFRMTNNKIILTF